MGLRHRRTKGAATDLKIGLQSEKRNGVMKIESIRLKNFKSFKDVELRDVPRFCVLIGANGTGKSTLFSLFAFLKAALSSNVHTALAKLGGSRGFTEVRSRGTKGNIEIELKFRERHDTPLVTYFLSIGQRKGSPVVESEVLKYRRGSSGQPWHFLDFSYGSGYAVTNELDAVIDVTQLDRQEQSLKSPDILAVKGLAQFERFPTEFLYTRHRDIFDKILKKLARRVPGISKVDAKTTEEGRVLLRFQDGAFKDPFLARYVSDGTIKMFAYLVLLYDPQPHPLLCVEEPENQLYPQLLWELAEEFQGYANRGGQVFVSTHSPDFLNAVGIDGVFWLVKEGGYTQVKRARDDPQLVTFIEEGDQMGYLWKQGLFDGADPP